MSQPASASIPQEPVEKPRNGKLRAIFSPGKARGRSGAGSTTEEQRSQTGKGPQPEGASLFDPAKPLTSMLQTIKDFSFRSFSTGSQRCRTVVRAMAALCLVLHLSGGPALLVQSVAWLQMANGAGGLRHLAWAMSEAPPCRGCEMAQVLQQPPCDETGVPAPRERLDFLRLALSGESRFELRTGEGVSGAEVHSRPRSERPLDSRSDRPATPPPRAELG